MSKQLRILFFTLVILVGFLSFSSTYFFSKSRNIATTDAPKVAGDLTNTPAALISSPPPTSPTNRASDTSDRPSHPTDKYTIIKGDSLLSIAQQNGLTLIELTEANGIEDANKIQAGQVII